MVNGPMAYRRATGGRECCSDAKEQFTPALIVPAIGHCETRNKPFFNPAQVPGSGSLGRRAIHAAGTGGDGAVRVNCSSDGDTFSVF